jgi:phosphoribosylaminoimidazole-succinocarboxamide synthase
MRGKVRDVYNIGDQFIVMVASDRISAFDHVLPHPIPYKGQVLNQIASKFLDATKHIVPNWKIAEPDPHATVGIRCEPYPVEFVVRGYLAGHAWRMYRDGHREICGLPLPDGLKQNDRLPEPILTPTTKAKEGHDMDISFDEIVSQRLIRKKQLEKLRNYAMDLYAFGADHAKKQNLILVDTKYEFGKKEEEIYLIDEIHTPDSSRYFYAENYQKIQALDQNQKQLSKEFVRQWLIDHGFQGLEGQVIPEMNESFIESVSNRYIELYEHITGEAFQRRSYDNIDNEIESAVNGFIASEFE